jgi:hypothetical protein
MRLRSFRSSASILRGRVCMSHRMDNYLRIDCLRARMVPATMKNCCCSLRCSYLHGLRHWYRRYFLRLCHPHLLPLCRHHHRHHPLLHLPLLILPLARRSHCLRPWVTGIDRHTNSDWNRQAYRNRRGVDTRSFRPASVLWHPYNVCIRSSCPFADRNPSLSRGFYIRNLLGRCIGCYQHISERIVH